MSDDAPACETCEGKGRTLPSNDQPWGDLARAYLALREAARPFAVCRAQVGPYGRVHPCNDCAGCRLARLIGGDDGGEAGS